MSSLTSTGLRSTSLAGVAAIIALAGACDDDGAAAPELNVAAVAAYNVGLATGFVDYAPQREAIVTELVAGLEADVVCLQEVWTEDQAEAIIDAAADSGFEHSYMEFIQDDEAGPPACTETEAEPMQTCVDDSCDGVPDSELAGCALDECEDEFDALSPGCQGCLANNLGNSIEVIVQTCTTGDSQYTWGGHNGLLMVSKVPLNDRAHHTLDSSLVQRSVLFARAELPRVGEVDIACTHLAADLSETIQYNGDHGSFAGEQTHQAEQLLALFDARGTEGVRVLTGDMNSGPAIAPDIDAEIPDAAYGVFADAGFVSWPVASDAPLCTYCAGNRLNSDDGDDVLIDHVFVQGLPEEVTVGGYTRFGDQTVEITDGNGDPQTTHPSDHYGVRVQFDFQP